MKSPSMNISFIKTSLSPLLSPHLLSPNLSKSKLLMPKFYSRLLPAVVLSLCTLSGCQKTPEPETIESTSQNTPVTSNINNGNQADQKLEAAPTNEPSVDEIAAETERENNLARLENNSSAEGQASNAEMATLSPQQPRKGTQVTDVRYRNAAGETLTVVFETSATGLLNAIVTLPNNTKMTLSAPEGQGNNPTYHSPDGDTELVSHEGGTAIDFIQNNKVTSFKAISAEAEVITQI
ncbi:hypothetical protein [Psychrobacter frigidicola]|nr:hypothetical protein [Psychrobacter frigidicola]